MLCDDRIHGVGDLFGDQVEVIEEVRRSELGKASDVCFAKVRGEYDSRVMSRATTYCRRFPTTTT